MSNRVSPEPGYEMSEKACVPKDSGHLFQLSSQDHPQQQQQQQQQQKQQQQQQQSDNIYIIETGEDEETSHPQGDEYLRAVTPADALFQSDPVVTLPEESAAPEAGTEDQSEQSQDQQVDDYVRISRDDNNQSPLLAENNTAASTVTAPVVVVQGRLPPLEPRPPQEPPVADASFESGTGFTDTATTTALDLGVGEAGGREQTTNQLGWSLPGAGIGNQAPYSSHSTSSAAAAAEEAPVSDWEFNTGQGKGPDNQTRFIQLRESEDSTLRERQTTRPSQPEMSAMNSRPNSAKRESEVIGANESSHESGCCAVILTALSYLLVVLFFPISLCATIKVVQEYERAVIFRLGRLLPGGAKGPGIFFVMPCIEEYSKVDLRTVSFDVPPQEVLTRDSVTVSVDAVVYYRISSPTISVANVENAANSTQLLAQTSLRNVLGTQNLSEILSNREHISEQMQNVLDDATDKWGIKVERVEIKDVRLPTQLQRAMAAEAEAARDARAKVIAAEGEQKASLALKEAADIITQSPAAIQLRYLQTLNSISAEKNSTIIFPLPIDMVASFMSGKK